MTNREYYQKNREEILVRRKAYQAKHKEEISVRMKGYYEKNREEISVRMKGWYEENKEEISVRMKGYYEKNREEIRIKHKARYEISKEKRRAHYATQLKPDPIFMLQKNLRSRLRSALRGKSKSARTLALLGCSIEFLRAHLEKQFVPGMTWKNYGTAWHVDHILPCAVFHLQHSEEQEICFHWTNLQPLFVKDNLSKSGKVI